MPLTFRSCKIFHHFLETVCMKQSKMEIFAFLSTKIVYFAQLHKSNFLDSNYSGSKAIWKWKSQRDLFPFCFEVSMKVLEISCFTFYKHFQHRNQQVDLVLKRSYFQHILQMLSCQKYIKGPEL